jgi:hypothetical protein
MFTFTLLGIEKPRGGEGRGGEVVFVEGRWKIAVGW